jgi:hypothetical protein
MKTLSSMAFLILVFLLIFKADASEVSSNASPVAQILGREITAADIGLKYDANKMLISLKNSGSSSALNDSIDGLCNLIMIEVVRDYVEKNKLKATDGEVREYKNYQDQFMANDRKRRQKQLEELEARLKDTTLTPKERKQAEKRRSTLLNLAKHEKHQAEMGQLTGEELRSVYGPFIEAWKFNKSVYEKYGGIVANTKFGPVPTEAKKDLLSQYEKDRKLLIFDENLKSNFWSRLAEPPPLKVEPGGIDFTPAWKKPLPKDENRKGQSRKGQS